MTTNNYSNHQATLRNDFGKLLELGQFADARLVCFEENEDSKEGGEKRRVTIPVHRAILTARSQIFVDLFGDGREELEIPEFPPKVVRALLSYLYSETIPGGIDDETLFRLYKAAEVYGVDIFGCRTIYSTIVIDRFPEGFASGNFGNESFCINFGGQTSDNLWTSVMQMETRGEGEEKRMHMDFFFRSMIMGALYFNKTFIKTLSLSVLTGGREKMTVTREGVFRNSVHWTDCFDFRQMIQQNLHQFRLNSGGDICRPELVVLAKATICSPMEFGFRQTVQDDDIQYSLDFGSLFETGHFSDARLICYEKQQQQQQQQPIDDEEGKSNDDGVGSETEKKVEIPVHRCILSARSKFFDALFSTKMREAEAGVVEIPPETGFSLDTIKPLLSYIYTGTVPALDQTALKALFKAAHLYEVHGLLAACVELFQLTTKNCCDWLCTADFYHNAELESKALAFIRQYIGVVEENAGYRRLMTSDRDQLKMKLPLTQRNCFELLLLADAYENLGLKGDALGFIRANLHLLKGSEAWHNLMASHHSELKMQLPLTVENCCELLWLAVVHGNEQLEVDAVQFIERHSDVLLLFTNTAREELAAIWSMGRTETAEEFIKIFCIDLALTAENCCWLLRLAHFYSLDAAKKRALVFLKENAEAVKATHGWRHLMEEGTDESTEANDTVWPLVGRAPKLVGWRPIHPPETTKMTAQKTVAEEEEEKREEGKNKHKTKR